MPEGLDLDAWIVPQAKAAALGESEETKERKKERRDRKGKGKEKQGERQSVGVKNGKKKVREDDVQAPREDGPDALAERARVRSSFPQI